MGYEFPSLLSSIYVGQPLHPYTPRDLFGTDDLAALELLGKVTVDPMGDVLLAFGPYAGTVLTSVDLHTDSPARAVPLPRKPGGGADARLDKLESMLAILVERQTVREWYTTEEFAGLVGKAEFTVREWCRRGRVTAEKRHSGRGAHPAWVISHPELLRYQREGLLPLRH